MVQHSSEPEHGVIVEHVGRARLSNGFKTFKDRFGTWMPTSFLPFIPDRVLGGVRLFALIHHPATINVESDEEVEAVRVSCVAQEFEAIISTGQLNPPFLPDAPNQVLQ